MRKTNGKRFRPHSLERNSSYGSLAITNEPFGNFHPCSHINRPHYKEFRAKPCYNEGKIPNSRLLFIMRYTRGLLCSLHDTEYHFDSLVLPRWGWLSGGLYCARNMQKRVNHLIAIKAFARHSVPMSNGTSFKLVVINCDSSARNSMWEWQSGKGYGKGSECGWEEAEVTWWSLA